MYLTASDMQKYYDVKLLVKLTNDDETVDFTDPDNINTDTLNTIIAYEAAIIENYLGELYNDVEPSESNPRADVEGMCADLTICRLWQRKASEPEQVTKLREQVTDRLHRLAVRADEIRAETTRETAKFGERE